MVDTVTDIKSEDLAWIEEYRKGMDDELHPDLVPFVVESEVMGPCLRHPVVYDVPLMNPGRANKQYVYKTEALRKAVVERNWHSYIWLHERPYRLDALVAIASRLTNQLYWEFVADVWIDSENIWQNFEEWQEVLGAERSYRHTMMDKDDRKALKAMPKVLTVYRGCLADRNENGLSWTLDKDRALWFAKRFTREDEAVLLTGQVEKANVHAYFSGRGEQEIVVHYAEVVEVTSREVVT